MPTWYEYEREANEIDELVALQRRRANNIKSTRKSRANNKSNPLGNIKCRCKRKAIVIIHKEPLCKRCFEKKEKEKQQNGK